MNDGNHTIQPGSHVCDACAVETKLTGSTRWYLVNGTWVREPPPCRQGSLFRSDAEPTKMVPDRKGGIFTGGRR